MTQLFHSQVFTQENWKHVSTKRFAQCSWELYSQQPQMRERETKWSCIQGIRKCGIVMQWSATQQHKTHWEDKYGGWENLGSAVQRPHTECDVSFRGSEFSNTQNYGRERAGQRVLLEGERDGKGHDGILQSGECSTSWQGFVWVTQMHAFVKMQQIHTCDMFFIVSSFLK